MDRLAATRSPLDSLAQIIRKIPKPCFERSNTRALTYLARDLLLAALLMSAIVLVDHWLVALLLSIVLGTVLTGLFVIGHDAGHRSFSNSLWLNNLVGHIALSPLLWPFHVWRLSHDVHHRWTHHVEREIAWRPLTVAEYNELGRVKKFAYGLTRSWLFFLASPLFQFYLILDAVQGRFFSPRDRTRVRLSLLITASVAVAYVAASWAVAGAYGIVWLFLVPQLVFHFWLSTFTLFHHTSSDNQLLADGAWTAEQAQLASTVHIDYPPLIEWLTHDISWHVPHHVCVGVPHYHLRQAHAALKAAYPGWVVEKRMSWELIREVTSQCHLVPSWAPDDQRWLRVDADAVALSQQPGLTPG